MGSESSVVFPCEGVVTATVDTELSRSVIDSVITRFGLFEGDLVNKLNC